MSRWYADLLLQLIHETSPSLSVLVLRAYSRAFPDINFQWSPRISFSRILVLPLKIRFVHGFWQFRGLILHQECAVSICLLFNDDAPLP
jgi:hypothetical protein